MDPDDQWSISTQIRKIEVFWNYDAEISKNKNNDADSHHCKKKNLDGKSLSIFERNYLPN